MKMSLVIACIALWLVLLGAGLGMAQQVQQRAEKMKFAVYYGDAIEADKFLPYDVIVFDADKHPPLRGLQHRGKVLLGYVSAFEAVEYRAHYAALQKAGLVFEYTLAGTKRLFFDIRDRKWQEALLTQIMTHVVREGFDGVMLDTLEYAVLLEQAEPKKYAGMQAAAVQTIRAIRMHYPYLKIMLNRAFELLPEVEMHIDMVLAESTLTHAFDSTKIRVMTQAEREPMMSLLRASKQRVPDLGVFTLDYWNMQDIAGLRKIYQVQRLQGYVPYVSTLDLQGVYPEPESVQPMPVLGEVRP
jgi:polysaccharide biosynthesis protein PelA